MLDAKTHILGEDAIPSELRKDIMVKVRPVRLTIISKLMEGVQILTKIDGDTLKAILEAERNAEVTLPDEVALPSDKATHEAMLSALEAIIDIHPRLDAWNKEMLAKMAPFADEPDRGEGSCPCPKCVAIRQKAAERVASKVEAAAQQQQQEQ